MSDNSHQDAARPLAEEGASPADPDGRAARAPLALPPRSWWTICKRVVIGGLQDQFLLIAAGVTFFMLLALVPALSAFIAIYGLFADQGTVLDHIGLLRGIVPEGGLEIVEEQLARLAGEEAAALGWALLISLAIAIWSASAGARALIQAMNVAYGEEEKRSFLTVTILALAFTLGFAVAAALGLSVVVILPVILALFPLGGALDWILRIASYGVLTAVLAFGLATLYRWGPSRRTAKWRWITPGALVAIVLVLMVSVGFSWYVSNFGNYSAAYGSLGALIGFLTWQWISVTLVILGGKLNAESEHQTARDSTTGPEKPLGQRGATMADTVA